MLHLDRLVEVFGLVLIFAKCYSACEFSESRFESRCIDPELQKAIDDFVRMVYLPESKISKLGLAIVKNNSEIVYSTGYGMADDKKGIPIRNETQFLLGSVTKSFTAITVIKVLHERFPEMGEAVLDTPVITLIPATINFTLADRYRYEHFTFRDLLSHRMCYSPQELYSFSEPFSETSEIIYRQRYAEEICGFRSEFQYNNHMYVVAGELAGILANKSYTQLVTELLDEIGMNNSILADKMDEFSSMPFRAQPYFVLNGTSYPMNPDLVKRIVVDKSAGGLYVSPNDMTKYINFLLNKGNVDGKEVIPQNVISWITKPSMHLSNVEYRSSDEGSFTSTFAYGLGMNLATYDGWEYNNHGGHFSPYNSLISLFPSQNLGIFTTSNEVPHYVHCKVVHMFIFEILRGTSSKDATEKLGKLWKNAYDTAMIEKLVQDEALETHLLNLGENPIKNNKEIVGKYGSGIAGDAEILIKLNPITNQTGLYIQHGKWARGWMEHAGGSVYKIIWDSDVVQEFYSNGDTNGFGYVGVTNKSLQIYFPHLGELETMGTFTMEATLDDLHTTPWDVKNC